MLIAFIGAAIVVVVALAVLTPTVIVDDNDSRDVVVRAAVLAPLPPGFGPRTVTPGQVGPLQKLRKCLEQQGFGPGDTFTVPAPGQLRKTFRGCRKLLPEARVVP
jgi:hypothetical protein